MPDTSEHSGHDPENGLVEEVAEVIDRYRMENGLTLEDAHYLLRAIFKLMREAYGTLEMTFAAQQELAWVEYHIRSCTHCVRYPWPGIGTDHQGLHPMDPEHPDLRYRLDETGHQAFWGLVEEEDDG